MAFVLPFVASAMTAIGSSAAATISTVTPALTSIAGATAPIASTAAIAAAETAPAWLGYAGMGLTALSGATGAIGAIKSAEASAASNEYNADVADMNAKIAKENAAIAGQSGEQQTWMQQQRTRSKFGSVKANQAASGISVNEGSALDVRSSVASLGELDAMTVRSNATREAYGYQNQEYSFNQQAKLDRSEAESDRDAGIFNAGSTILGSVGSGASNFAKFQAQGGFNA